MEGESRDDEEGSDRRLGRHRLLRFDRFLFVGVDVGVGLFDNLGMFRIVERRRRDLAGRLRRLGGLVRMEEVVQELLQQTDGEEPETHDQLRQRKDRVDLLVFDS